MLLIEGKEIKKYYGEQLILEIDEFKIYSQDRIGLVGRNGVGKTTLLRILSKQIEVDEGKVLIKGLVSYVSQLEEPTRKEISEEVASKFGIQSTWSKEMSGGEKTRFKIADALTKDSSILFADEPTSNLDMDSIEYIEERFQEYEGALVVISHDRSFLDKLCNKIVEVENGKIKIYNGNYTDYKKQKLEKIQRETFEYEQYIKEKNRLRGTITDTNTKAKRIKRTPRRMGNSEARLHKMGGQKSKSTLERKVKNIEKRIEHLEVKDKPKKSPGIKLDILERDKVYSKIIIEANNINKSFGERHIFKDSKFHIKNGSKVALIGPNGSGKSTLIKMIMDGYQSIKVAPSAKIGYFSQSLNILDKNKTILENIMEESVYPEHFARTILAGLLFKENEVNKTVNLLSGGERVKASLAKILLQDINLLILDEPTNYMDIDGLEAIQNALKTYNQTILFVSHDRHFIDSIADHILSIEHQSIRMYAGNYTKYLNSKTKGQDTKQEDIQKRKMILRNRLSEIIGKLSMTSKEDDVTLLDAEYYKILDELRKLK